MAGVAATMIFLYSISKLKTLRERPQTGGFQDTMLHGIPLTPAPGRTHRAGNVDQEQQPHFLMSSALRSTADNAPNRVPPNTTRIMVIPRMQQEDITWISKELPELDVYVYIADNITAAVHPPKNKGHEVMVYLSYIIEHFDDLPDIVLFMHAHRWTHHNNELLGSDAVQMVQRLNSAYVLEKGYFNMRCHWSPGCPEWLHPMSRQESMGKQEEAVLAQSWKELFPFDPLPAFLGQPCCAQFALSKQRILSLPLSRYIFFRDWILRTTLSDYVSGRIWEYSWQYIFANQAAYCPAEHICYCAGFGVCFGGERSYKKYFELVSQKQKLEEDLQDVQKMQTDQQKNASFGRNETGSSHGPGQSSSHPSPLQEEIARIAEDINRRKDEAFRRGGDSTFQDKDSGSSR
ncbi:MAG: hypothetical protein Q9190_001667 [Brigantiaea leucoxantha]